MENKEAEFTDEEKLYLSKAIHINATPEFLKNPESMKVLAKAIKLAYNHNLKSKT